jgi:hypothetical protein
MLAVRLVVRHQMERGFATRMLQHGPVLAAKGASQALRGLVAVAPCGYRRAGCSRADWQTIAC